MSDKHISTAIRNSRVTTPWIIPTWAPADPGYLLRQKINVAVIKILSKCTYRTRSINGRSRLMAASQRNHAKSQFL